MLIVYHSKTGNIKRFINKVELVRPNWELLDRKEIEVVLKPFIIITNTTGFGEVPEIVDSFLDINRVYLKGVASSGNRNWGSNFAKSGDVISKKYNVPLLCKFELSGTQEDLINFITQVELLTKKAIAS